MGLFGFLKSLAGAPPPDRGRGIDDVSKRLGMSPDQIRGVPAGYQTFTIPKRSDGTRTISAPNPALKEVQRKVLRKILGGLPAHPTATGFERGHSIVTNAKAHAGQSVVVRMDLKDFFGSTSELRIRDWFFAAGWNREASVLLSGICTRENALPQGAPTSPRLANLVNFMMDARLESLARSMNATYTRYADDLTFSFPADADDAARRILGIVKFIVADFGYALHTGKKFRIRRAHQRQTVTGLVVNEKVALPRETRRWLRAVEHRLKAGKPATLTPAQIAGWRSFASMVEKQSGGADATAG
ncbi:MAG: reverse transcriptase family protein [Planctomycetota bacterium]